MQYYNKFEQQERAAVRGAFRGVATG